MSLRRRSVLRVLLLCFPAAASSQGTTARELRVIAVDDSPVTKDVLQLLTRRHPALQVARDAKALVSRRGPATYVAIGPAAFQSCIDAELDAPTVALFTSSAVYMNITEGLARRRSVSLTAIYAEPSPEHQLELIAQLYGRRVSVAVLLSERTLYLQSLLRQSAKALNLDIDIQRVTGDQTVFQALNSISAARVLLAVPDPRLYTATTLRTVLETTYRRGQGVIGFSAGLVTAGTLASAYSSVDDILIQVEETLSVINTGRTPEPQFPRYWRVALNESVARSLNIVITDDVRKLGDRPAGKPL